MMEQVQQNEQHVAQAPGCFGAASVFSLDSAACVKCVAYNPCRTKSRETLEAIRGKIDVSDVLARHEKARQALLAKQAQPEPTAVQSVAQPAPIVTPVERKTGVQRVHFEVSRDQQDAIARIGSKKTQELAISLCKMNKVRSIRADVLAGINPFADSGHGFMRVTCAALIGGGFTKAQLKQRLMDELVWTDGTAAAHVSQAIGFMEAFGVIVGKAGFYSVAPDAS